MSGKSNRLEIRTPEGISFSLKLASPVSRFLAWMVDMFVIAMLMSLLGAALSLTNWISSDLYTALTVLGYFLVSIGYGIFMEWLLRGQTIGKRILRLRVMDESGLQLKFSQVVIRNLLRFIDSLPGLYFVGGTASAISRRSQRLGDFAANTIVIRSPRVVEPDIDQLALGKFNSFRRYPHLEARMRQQITRPEASLALSAVLRREELDPDARVSLFNDLAAYFKQILHFPEEISRDISSEQYLRNMVDSLYRQREKG